jgi:hypothetical protein
VQLSILIPTKDRPSLLRLAVQSVRDQDYDDWENRAGPAKQDKRLSENSALLDGTLDRPGKESSG